MWKASNVLLSHESNVQVSAAYNETFCRKFADQDNQITTCIIKQVNFWLLFTGLLAGVTPNNDLYRSNVLPVAKQKA